MEPWPNLYTPMEVAARLRVDTKVVRQLCADGSIAALNIGGQWVIPEDAFHEFLQARIEESTRPVASRPQTRPSTPVTLRYYPIVKRFIEECCVTGRQSSCGAAELYEAYGLWNQEQDDGAPMSSTAFGRVLSTMFQKQRTRWGQVYHGVDLVPPYKTRVKPSGYREFLAELRLHDAALGITPAWT